MEIDKLFGLPAHPFLVHAPLVLIPLLAVAAIALVVQPRWRDRWGVPLVLAAIVVAGMAVAAAGSGEQLERRVVETALVEQHAELGEQLRTIVLALAGAIAAWIAAHRYGSRVSWLARTAAPLAVLVLAGSVAATVWDVRAGHAGAKATWKQAADLTPRAGEEE